MLPRLVLILSMAACGDDAPPSREAGDRDARPADARTAEDATAPRLDSGTDAGASVADRLADLEAARAEAWGTVYPRTTFGITNEWEVVYEADGFASEGVPNHLRWDSFVDDDFRHPEWGFQPDTPIPGILTVDRLSYALDATTYACPYPTPPAGGSDPTWGGKTGNIWRRDEILHSETEGFTMEVRVRIFDSARECSAPAPAAALRDGFGITVVDDEGNYAAHLSPGLMRLGALNADDARRPFSEYPVTTTAWHTYRVVRHPSADDPGNFYVYVDDEMLPDDRARPYAGNRLAGDAETRAHRDGRYYSYPRILVGDNSNDADQNARYELDYVYYRRGVVPQLRAAAPVARRTPPPLPPNEPTPSAAFATGREITVADLGPGGTLPAPFRTNGPLTAMDGAIRFTSMTHAMLGFPEDEPSLPHVQPLTLELAARVAATSELRGFVVEHIDLAGQLAIVLSPDRVELFMDSSPYGMAVHFMDTTDRVHRYRAVRVCSSPGANDCLYVHLYVDDDPVPVIVDQHLGGTVLDLPRLWIGDLAYADIASAPDVFVESVRWSRVAFAPPL
jgi:hypothetical protein